MLLYPFTNAGVLSRVIAVEDAEGLIDFEMVGIHVIVPANALPHGQSNLIMISVITDIPKHLHLNADDTLVAFGVECLPDGLRLQSPVTIVFPHCAVVADIEEVTPVVYSWSGERGQSNAMQSPVMYT